MLNFSKTKLKRMSSITLHGNSIDIIRNIMYLRVIFTHNLPWDLLMHFFFKFSFKIIL